MTNTYGFDIEAKDGLFYVTRNGTVCLTGLGRPISRKTRQAAENYVRKEVERCEKQSLITDEYRQAMREQSEREVAAMKAERDAAYDARLKRERDAKEARWWRAILNDHLRRHGYRWRNLGFRDEEEADAFDIHLPIGDDWRLISSDGRVVSVEVAQQEIKESTSQV